MYVQGEAAQMALEMDYSFGPSSEAEQLPHAGLDEIPGAQILQVALKRGNVSIHVYPHLHS